ncbi:MAG: hypothetical protein KY475_16015, partial [Planctomycetes bacterium]|nr:hypothetical protein [Planctomycetota bacterium]
LSPGGAAQHVLPSGLAASAAVDLGSVFWMREDLVGTKKTGKGRRKVGRKKRRMRAKIRHRKR